MTLNELQQKVDEWVKTVGVRYFSELTNMAILTEEVGELARIISRKYGDQSFKEGEQNFNAEEEIADILFVTVCLANQMGIDLKTSMEKGFEKRNKRDIDRHRKNEKLKK